MNHTLAQFETALLTMNVMITNINTPDGFVQGVSGILDNINYTWNAAGHCFRGKVRIPALDVIFRGDYSVSINEKRITHFNESHKFKIRLFKYTECCSKCSLLKECNSLTTEDFPFPCHSGNRKDKRNGYFKLQK